MKPEAQDQFVYTDTNGKERLLQENCDLFYDRDGEGFLASIYKCIQCAYEVLVLGDRCPPDRTCNLFRNKERSQRLRKLGRGETTPNCP